MAMTKRSVFLGYDPRETEAFAIARRTFRRHAPGVSVDAIDLGDMRDLGLYTRPTSRDDKGRLFDDISGFPMATEFAISRFLTPILAREGWALFADCDVMARGDVNALFLQCDPSKAVMCVKHRHAPPEGLKMDGQAQLRYARKNWSSVMAFNCGHPANQVLTVDLINSAPGRDLHRFCWLPDDLIGDLDQEWNFLVGHTDQEAEPSIVHWTEGGPWLPEYRNAPFADEWLEERRAWLEEGRAVKGQPKNKVWRYRSTHLTGQRRCYRATHLLQYA